MPVYEFICQNCLRRVRLTYSYAEYDSATPVCSYCESRNLVRRIGRVGVAKSEESRLDALSDDSMLAGLDEEDPRALGHFMRKMASEMGEDLGEEFDEVVDRLEKGQSPEEIEESMPELGAADAGMPGMEDEF